MGKSSRSHSKKSDKETQSPMLKIFKDIMQRERNEHKTEVIKEKRKKRKKMSAFPTKLKSQQERREKSDSSGVTRLNTAKFVIAEGSRISKDDQLLNKNSSMSNPIQSEKRESWWLWGDPCSLSHNNMQPNSTACSCVSCQLKKVLTNEYTCIGILVFLFCISMIVAWILMSKTCLTETEPKKAHPGSDPGSDDADKFQRLNMKSTGDDCKRLDFGREIRRSVWDDAISKTGDSLPALSGYDFGETSFLNTVKPGRNGRKLNSDVGSFVNLQKLNGENVSPQIKNFYKKLMETDAQIKNLKKGLYNPSIQINNKKDSYRLKRSLFRNYFARNKTTKKSTTVKTAELDSNGVIFEGEFGKKDKRTKNTNLKRKVKPRKPSAKVRRFANGSAVPEGFIFQRKQLIVQYLSHPSHGPTFPKCSHLPKQLERKGDKPYLKNPEKLDKLLDQFLKDKILDKAQDKSTSDLPAKLTSLAKADTPTTDISTETTSKIATDDLSPTTLNSNPYVAESAKHKNFFMPHVSKAKQKIQRIWSPNSKELPTFRRMWEGDTMTASDGPMKYLRWKDDSDINYVTLPQYDIVLSISTLMSPNYYVKKESDKTVTIKSLSDKNQKVFEELPKFTVKGETVFGPEKVVAKVPVRKLQQMDEQDENEEGLGYEDFKEVLSDYSENHDETDRQHQRDRKRRDNEDYKSLNNVPSMPLKFLPPSSTAGVFNPNWKGPAPLYPDEINTMIKTPSPSKELYTNSGPNQKTYTIMIEPNIKETNYNENGFGKDNDKLVNLAQAYSDYGVLTEKSQNLKNMNKDTPDHKIKISTERTEDRLRRKTTLKITTVIFESPAANSASTKSHNMADDTGGYGQDAESEGISIRLEPYSDKSREDDPAKLLKALKQHIGLCKSENKEQKSKSSTTLIPMSPIYEVIFNPTHYLAVQKKKTQQNKDFDYVYNEKRRTSKSKDYIEPDTENKQNYVDPFGSASYKDSNSNGPPDSGDQAGTNYDFPDYNDKPNSMGKNSFASRKNEHSEDPEKNNPNSKNDIFDIIFAHKNETIAESMNEKPTSEISTATIAEEFPLYSGSYKNNSKKLGTLFVSKTRHKRDTNVEENTTKIIETVDESISSSESALNNIRSKYKLLKDYKAATATTTNKNMGAGEFFELLSDWFSKLAKVSEDTANESEHIDKRPIERNVTQDIKNAKDITYPVYDSDMVDNIGHRSRVLLSIEEDHANASDNFNRDKTVTHKKTADTNVSSLENKTSMTASNDTNTDVIIITNLSDKKNEKLKNYNALAKRSAKRDQNLVFWNDMYDDEYGLKLDPLDEDKVFGKRSDSVVKKSADWIQDKMRRMTDSIKKKSKDGLNKLYKTNKRENRDTERFGMKTFLKGNINNFIHKITKRESLVVSKDKELDKKRNFAIMTAHMKEVCKQAAQAVQKTRSISPREDHESEVARGLMQNLVKMMSDLVDFEVNQRTCLTLPADLKGFLEWLTIPIPTPNTMHTKNIEIMYPNHPAEEIPSGIRYPTANIAEDTAKIVEDSLPEKPIIRVSVARIPISQLEILPIVQTEPQNPKSSTDLLPISHDLSDLISAEHTLSLPREQYPVGRLEFASSERDDDSSWLTCMPKCCQPCSVVMDRYLEMSTTQTSEKEEVRTDARSECLGTLHAVQDLIMEYAKLSDEDKSKMYGVKEYLEDQLDFLNKQISSLNEVHNVANFYSNNIMPLRIRRDLHLKDPEYLRRRQYRHLNTRNKRRFLKNYSKKHTKTTANNFESLQVSTESIQRKELVTKTAESMKKEPKLGLGLVEDQEEDHKDVKKRQTEDDDKAKSNLQDVYYKALTDANQIMTPNNLPRQAEFVTGTPIGRNFT